MAASKAVDQTLQSRIKGASMTVQKNFKVVSNGAFVAGQRSPGKGKTIKLTNAQAQYPLIMGDIIPEDLPARQAKNIDTSKVTTKSDEKAKG